MRKKFSELTPQEMIPVTWLWGFMKGKDTLRFITEGVPMYRIITKPDGTIIVKNEIAEWWDKKST